jgi:hypothetical protein
LLTVVVFVEVNFVAPFSHLATLRTMVGHAQSTKHHSPKYGM